MVLPFLTLYLTQSLGFNVMQAGQLLSLYGVGSILGAVSYTHLTLPTN